MESQLNIKRKMEELIIELVELGKRFDEGMEQIDEFLQPSTEEIKVIEKIRAYGLKRLRKGNKLLDALQEYCNNEDQPKAKLLCLNVHKG